MLPRRGLGRTGEPPFTFVGWEGGREGGREVCPRTMGMGGRESPQVSFVGREGGKEGGKEGEKSKAPLCGLWF